MELMAFDNYNTYLRLQRRTLKRRGIGPYFCDDTIRDICSWLKANKIEVNSGICHGARCGRECDSFLERFPNAYIIGTDIHPKSGKTKEIETCCEVIEHDFMKERSDWIGKFDFVYTNSFDHVYNPCDALDTWLKQLTENGRIFLHWVYGCVPIGGGDCFGAHIDEYMTIGDECGFVDDVIFSRGKSRRCLGMTVIVVIKKKEVT